MSDTSYVHVRGQRPEHEVADVFRAHWDTYRQTHPVTAEQEKVVADLVACRTAALGGTAYECTVCGAVELAYCSCRNRHCPKCQKFAKAQWVEAQKIFRLPTPYFHLVFTTDHVINAWVPANRAVIYTLLFATASGVLKDFAARELGGTLGMSAALHTWSQTLLGHVHVHFIVTGGALSFDSQRWVASPAGYLFDIVAVSAAFREAFCAGLLKLAEAKRLVGVALSDVQAGVATMRAKAWEVFIKPFAAPEAVYEYLSRYVHAVAISNYRLTDLAEGQVSFTYHDNQDEGKKKILTVSAEEFIRRFLWHLLPAKFVRIRHYGLHQSAARAKQLPQARKVLGLAPALPQIPKLVLADWLAAVVGEALHRCHYCGASGSMAYRWEVAQMPPLWLWLKLIVGWVVGPSFRASAAAATA